MGAHEGGEIEAAVRGTQEERATFVECGDGLAREVVVGHQPAAVGRTVPGGDEQSLEDPGAVDVGTERFGKFREQADPRIQFAGAVVAVHHRHPVLAGGVVTRSSSRCTWPSSCSSTIIAKMLVPALTFPVRGATELVATMPVPASPSGGHMGIPGCSSAAGSKLGAGFGELAGGLAGDRDRGQ